MSDQEAPEPSAAASKIGSEDEDAGSDQNQVQASMQICLLMTLSNMIVR